jgi:hypothetical protein
VVRVQAGRRYGGGESKRVHQPTSDLRFALPWVDRGSQRGSPALRHKAVSNGRYSSVMPARIILSLPCSPLHQTPSTFFSLCPEPWKPRHAPAGLRAQPSPCQEPVEPVCQRDPCTGPPVQPVRYEVPPAGLSTGSSTTWAAGWSASSASW